ncbi:MAG: TonB family protein [Paludibacteraceae bacterium]|nr:TonB family protein [Paludibacteraceae bacterium]
MRTISAFLLRKCTYLLSLCIFLLGIYVESLHAQPVLSDSVVVNGITVRYPSNYAVEEEDGNSVFLLGSFKGDTVVVILAFEKTDNESFFISREAQQTVLSEKAKQSATEIFASTGGIIEMEADDSLPFPNSHIRVNTDTISFDVMYCWIQSHIVMLMVGVENDSSSELKEQALQDQKAILSNLSFAPAPTLPLAPDGMTMYSYRGVSMVIPQGDMPITFVDTKEILTLMNISLQEKDKEPYSALAVMVIKSDTITPERFESMSKIFAEGMVKKTPQSGRFEELKFDNISRDETKPFPNQLFIGYGKNDGVRISIYIGLELHGDCMLMKMVNSKHAVLSPDIEAVFNSVQFDPVEFTKVPKQKAPNMFSLLGEALSNNEASADHPSSAPQFNDLFSSAPKAQTAEDDVLDYAAEQPQFRGGQKALSSYMGEAVKGIHVPNQPDVRDRTICSFVVNKDGTLSDIQVVKSSGSSILDRAAINIIRSMPGWLPGADGGKSVRVRMTMPIIFHGNTGGNTSDAKGQTLNPKPESCQEGALHGQFSVSTSKTVHFAKGNLQYQASTRTWRFADNQYDFIGLDNRLISEDYDGWIDYFGFGTGNHPTTSTRNGEDYATYSEWGNNTILNGGNRPMQWRTLSYNEFWFLFWKRKDADKLFGLAEIDGVCGIILLPDGWREKNGLPRFICWKESKENSLYREKSKWINEYDKQEWAKLEVLGAVFLPAVGARDGKRVGVIDAGNYFTSSPAEDDTAYELGFNSNSIAVRPCNRYYGCSIRLVCDCK